MDLLGSGLAEIDHPGLGGGSPHDGIIDHDDALPLHSFTDEVELHADIEVADELGRLNEGAADVVVAHEGRVVGDSKFFREAQRGVDAGIGHRNHDVGLDRVKARQFASHVHARPADRDAAQAAVGAGEVDVLKDAEGLARGCEGEFRADSLTVDHDHFPGLEVPDELRADQVECAGLGREDPGAVHLAEGEGSEAVRVTDTDDLVLAHDDDGEGSLESAKGPDGAARGLVWLGHQVKDDLAVHRRLEDRAPVLEFVAERSRVHEVAVVGHGELTAGSVDDERLGVKQGA